MKTSIIKEFTKLDKLIREKYKLPNNSDEIVDTFFKQADDFIEKRKMQDELEYDSLQNIKKDL